MQLSATGIPYHVLMQTDVSSSQMNVALTHSMCSVALQQKKKSSQKPYILYLTLDF